LNSELSPLDRIQLRKAKIAVVGLGHVGLPTALIFARAGFDVVGVDVDSRKLDALKRGRCYLWEPGLQDILVSSSTSGAFQVTSRASESVRSSDFVSICVPTPVKNGRPDLRCFKSALNEVKAGLHRGMVVLIQSTLPPSTTSKFVVPELQAKGYRVDEDVFLAYCPERLAPTHALEEFVRNTRIVGGAGPRSGRIAAELFKTVCNDVRISDATTAELAKVAENTFRDLNVAYANLLAVVAEQVGVDVVEVIELANTHPRVRIHAPGLGVGGPCIPKDPHMLLHGIRRDVAKLVRFARDLNDHASKRAVGILAKTLAQRRTPIRAAKVAVLGVSYKPDTDDVTNSPAEFVIESLLEMKAAVVVYDPYTAETYGAKRATSVEEALRDSDCVIIVTGHTEFKSLDVSLVRECAKPDCVILDGPRVLDPIRAEAVGLTYLGTGYAKAR